MQILPLIVATSQPKAYRAVVAVAFLLIVALFGYFEAAQAQSDEPLPLPGSSGSEVASSGKSCVTHSNPIQVPWFYKPPKNVGMKDVIRVSDFYILTKKDEKYLNKVHKKGDGKVLQYLKYDAVNDPCFQAKLPKDTPCSCSQPPLNNNVGWNPGDICWIRDNHPEWFLRDKNGDLIYWNDFVMIDPGQQSWRDFWISRIRASVNEGWDGVFLDNVGTRFTRHGEGEMELQKYSLSEYRDVVTGFFKYVYEDYFQPNDQLFMGNISVVWGDDEVYARYLQYMDGAMDEFWAYPRSGYYSVEAWERRLLRMDASIKNGDVGILVAQGGKRDYTRLQFGLATYLLVADDKAYFRYIKDSRYEKLWDYETYLMKLGEPLGGYTRSGNTWTRQFANGMVTVNPETQTSSIILHSPDGVTCS